MGKRKSEGGRKGLLGADKVHFLNNMVIKCICDLYDNETYIFYFIFVPPSVYMIMKNV